jgi:CubicO group peptidase (beta-lactamase class C family)
MPRPLSSTLRPPSALTRRLGLALALWAAACGKTPQTQPPSVVPAAPVAKPAAKSDLPARLERLSARLEAAREQHHIPGMAVAVVKGDEVIFAKGFGLADLETKRPVTPKTLFAVGSTTKAFTSALVAMQIDAGKLAWDDPLIKHVPELKLQPRPAQTSNAAGDEPKGPQKQPATPQLTLRDALCHRSGFTRMSLLWASGELSTTEVFTQASGAEPVADFREKFLYNNEIYAAAGEAAARSAGTTWIELLQTRLLDPLGMKSTNATAAAAQADPRLARGYRWREVTEVHELLPMRPIDAIPAAGSINSNALDMAQWLRLQLGRGTYDGKQLISAERLQDTWSRQIEIGGGLGYGLGWMLGDWQGHRMVEHGGNIDGYAAEVGMLPDDQLGFVLLTNVSVTPLQRESLGIVFDSLLGELPKPGAEGPALDLRPYTGRYVADFASFDDVRFTVTDEGGKLFVDVPGQTKYELRPPTADGRWAFALTDTIQVSFDREGDDPKRPPEKSQVMHMFQGGLDFELPREGYSFPPDFDPSEVAAEIGRYRAEDGPAATVRLDGGRLVADIEGQMAFVLQKPDAEGRWRFRAKDDIAVSFRRDAKGRVDALVIHQGGVDKPLPRVATKDAPLPTVEQLLAKSQAARFDKRLEQLGPIEITGKVRIPSSNVEGRFRMVFDAQHRHRVELDLGRHGRIIETYDGTVAWSVSNLEPPTQAQGKYLRQAGLANPMLAGDWTRGFSKATVEGRVGKGADERVVVVLRTDDLPPMKLYVDPKRGDVRSTEQIVLAEGAGAIPTQSELGEFRKVLGLRLPHRVSTSNEHSGPTIFEVEVVKKAEGDPAALFTGPAKL